MNKQTFIVSGMTCGHCAMSVDEEVREIPGVIDVKVDHNSGILDIFSNDEIDSGAIKNAVEQAGYSIAQTD